jgi:C1A family cysteine protease
VKQGVCTEDEWPYSTDLDVVTEKPPDQAYVDALQNKVIAYHRVTQNLRQMKGCLAEGYPFVFGFAVYESFESDDVARTGVVPMPDPNVEEQVGGHAVMAVGIRRQPAALSDSQFLGCGLGNGRIFHHALCVSY